VSRQHCALSLRDDTLTVSDLGSANGTWVNGEPATSATILREGDLIEVGDESIEVLSSALTKPRDAQATEKDLPLYHAEADDEVEATTVTQAQTSSVALIESLVANASSALSPNTHFGRVRQAVENYVKGTHRVQPTHGALERQRLMRSIEATQRLDGSAEATEWRHRMLAELSEQPAAKSQPRH
jgi:predicted component of type VI protein secretion system